jgi:hypothetical protein
MKRTRVTEWPAIRVNVNPLTLEQLQAQAEARALSVAALVREAVDRAYGPRPRTLSEAR